MRSNSFSDKERAITFLVPDASRSGAPIQLLHLLRWFKSHSDLNFRIVLFQDGPLAADFSALAPTVTLTEVGFRRSRLVRKIGKIPVLGSGLKRLWHRVVTPQAVNASPSLFYANSVTSANLIRSIVRTGAPLMVHVHEMERAIQTTVGSRGMANLKALAQHYVATSLPVRRNLITSHGIEPALIDLIPYGFPIDTAVVENREIHRRTVRERLGIPAHAAVVAGCGATEHRKGVDLFVDMARLVRDQLKDVLVHFVWVGRVLNDAFTRSVMCKVRESGLSSVCHFVGEQTLPIEFFCACDVFALPSREEPMGIVALEAASLGKPIICFAGAGGMPDFVGTECGTVVTPMTAEALAGALIDMLSASERREALGRRAFEKVRKDHHIDVVAPRILKVIQSTKKADGRCIS